MCSDFDDEELEVLVRSASEGEDDDDDDDDEAKNSSDVREAIANHSAKRQTDSLDDSDSADEEDVVESMSLSDSDIDESD